MTKKLLRPVQSRAISAEAKLERRGQILDAAEDLIKRHGHADISVAEVARKAGVAKGTVYLYFQTKEEIYLGLHQRWIDRKLNVFSELIQDTHTKLDGVAIGSAMAKTMISETYGLVTASTCHSLMETHIALDAAYEFKLRLAQRLGSLGQLIEQRFPHLKPGTGARLLIQGYALTVGLWQMMDTSSRWRKLEKEKGFEVFNADFSEELHAAHIALWRGAIDCVTKSKRKAS